jgi:ABC-type transporter Mla maintaining outer membrane lipid asymmetry ATPase subunit MlaF
MSESELSHNMIEAQELVPEGEQAAMSVSLQRGDRLYIIGPDSTRLSQYLRTLAGVRLPQSGELLLFGRPLESLDKKSWREQRQHIGFVARNAPILSVLRGLDNVMLPALYHKRMNRGKARKVAKELIAKIGCRGNYDRLPAYLSKQQRLQLAIARATILDPPLLFMEEPFIDLSLAEQLPIYQYLVNWAETHTLVVATHNLQLVRESATQLLYIGDFEVHHFDSWQEFTASEQQEIRDYLRLYHRQMHIL